MDELRRAWEVIQRYAAGSVESPKVAELWGKYAEWGTRHRKSWNTSQEIHWRCHLEDWWGERRIGELSLVDADSYRAWRSKQVTQHGQPPRPNTVNHELSSMRACFSWVVKRRLHSWNPLAGLEMEPGGGGRRYWLTEPVFQRLLSWARPQLFGKVLIVGFDTGMREGEILALERSQVNLEAMCITLGDGDVKNHTGRIVPLTERAAAAIRECPQWSRFVFSREDGGPIPKSTLTDWFRAARERAGLPDECKFHSLRHSYGNNARQRGVHGDQIMATMGHKSEAAARIYRHFNEADLEAIRQKMNAGIAESSRKTPLRSVDAAEKPESASELAEKRKG